MSVYLLSLFFAGLSVAALRLFPSKNKRHDYIFIAVSAIIIGAAFVIWKEQGILGGALLFHVIAILIASWRAHLSSRACIAELREWEKGGEAASKNEEYKEHSKEMAS